MAATGERLLQLLKTMPAHTDGILLLWGHLGERQLVAARPENTIPSMTGGAAWLDNFTRNDALKQQNFPCSTQVPDDRFRFGTVLVVLLRKLEQTGRTEGRQEPLDQRSWQATQRNHVQRGVFHDHRTVAMLSRFNELGPYDGPWISNVSTGPRIARASLNFPLLLVMK